MTNLFLLSTVPVSSSWTEIGTFNEVKHAVNGTLHHLLDRMSNHLEVGSGFVYRAILNLDINISKTNLDSKSEIAQNTSQMCSGSPTDQITRSKFGHNLEFDLSPFMRKRYKTKTNTVLDVKNGQDRCFLFAIAAALYQNRFETLEEKENAMNYEELISKNFNIANIRAPTPFEDIKKFVDQNEHLDININIYTVKEDKFILVLPNISNTKKYGNKNVNLLALFPKSECEENQKEMELGNAHFVVINKIEELFAERDEAGRIRKKPMCHLCHAEFTSSESEKFKKHKKFCTNVRGQIQNMPDKNFKLKFDESDFDKQYLNEYVIFYDFECILRDAEKNNTCGKRLSVCKCPETNSFTKLQQDHVPMIYNFHIVNSNNEIVFAKTKYCRKGNAAEKMLKFLFRHEKEWIEEMSGNEPLIQLTGDQKREILKKQNNRCRHCRKKCSFEKDDLVVDHSHFNGEIHGISHNLWYWFCFLNFNF